MLPGILSTAIPFILAVIMLLLFYSWMRRGSDLPPGPTPWPVIGNLPCLRGNIMETLEGLRKEYGDVYSLYLGNTLTVFVHGLDAIKEVLVTRGEEFADRPKTFITEQMAKFKGIGSASGEPWRQQRQFTLHTLRDFGFGKSSMEEVVLREAGQLIHLLEATNGVSFPIQKLIHISVLNVISSIVFGETFSHADEKTQSYLVYMEENAANIGVGALNFLPWLKYLPGDIFHYHRILRNLGLVEEFFLEQIKAHRQTLNPANPRDFIDAYLAEIENYRDKKQASYINDDQLVKTIGDLFAAGTETTSTSLNWALVYLINNLKVQEKLREEIHTVIGKSRLPSMKDRKNMPLMEATILELTRCGDIAYTNVPHASKETTTLKGYRIPKGTTIITVLTSIHKDPEVWKDPETFDPTRFLDSEGNVMKSEHWLPFSAGKRVCLGETLARMELFLFLTTMLQRFVFKLPDGMTSLPTEPLFGVTRSPLPVTLRAVSDL